jgi:hypothetical protein
VLRLFGGELVLFLLGHVVGFVRSESAGHASTLERKPPDIAEFGRPPSSTSTD